MPTIEITSRVTRRSLMNRTKDELATRVLELMDEVAAVRDRLARTQVDLNSAQTRNVSQRLYDDAAGAAFEELRAAAKAALGEIPCGPEWLERLRSAVAATSYRHTEASVRGRMDSLAQNYFEKVIRERDEAVARAAAAEADLASFRGCLDRVDAILDANDGHLRRGIEALAKAKAARTRDADLPAVVSPCA